MLHAASTRSSPPTAARLGAVLQRHDSVVHLQDLLAHGFSRRQVAAMLHSGALVRPRIGWYASPDLRDDAVRAVRVGGTLGCVSAAPDWRIVVPTGPADRLHVSLPQHATRMRSSDDMRRRALAGDDERVHWHWEQRVDPTHGSRVGVLDTLLQMAACVPEKWLLAAIDSALQPYGRSGEPLLTEADLGRLRSLLPERLRYLVDLADARSQSAGESLAKYGFHHARIPFDLQSPIAGRYFGDIVLDRRLLVEVDGSEFHSGHEAFVHDRERDAAVAWWGMRTLRFTQRQVDTEWPWVLEVVQRVRASTSHAPA